MHEAIFFPEKHIRDPVSRYKNTLLMLKIIMEKLA